MWVQNSESSLALTSGARLLAATLGAGTHHFEVSLESRLLHAEEAQTTSSGVPWRMPLEGITPSTSDVIGLGEDPIYLQIQYKKYETV